MIKEGMWKNAILIIAMCFIVILTLIDVGLFGIVKIQTLRINELTNQSRQQQIRIESLFMQFQQCETIDDVDKVLKLVNVERIK